MPPDDSQQRLTACIPAELRALPQWVIWAYGSKPNRSGKRPKIPISPRTFSAADITDPATWGSLQEALAALRSRPAFYEGLGFVFSQDDPYTGVDIDSCIESGRLIDEASNLVKRLAGAYFELSPSGTGIHAIVRAQLPGPGRRRGKVECYDRARFFTITGRALESLAPVISDAQPAIDTLYSELGGPAGAAPATLPTEALDWGFVAWLEARMHRLIGADGLPYGATPQLRALLTRGELPANLGRTDSDRRALVVAQLARAGRLAEETYVLARHIWARYGYESTKRPQDLLADALRLLAKNQVAPESYSLHSLARFQDYRHSSPGAQKCPPEAAQRHQRQRRAPVGPDVYLEALSGLAVGSGVVLATRVERAEAAGVTLATAERLERKLRDAGVIQIEVYSLLVSDGRHTRASKITLIPVSTSADADTGIIGIEADQADADTGAEEAAPGISTQESADHGAVYIGENTVVASPPTPRAPGVAPTPPTVYSPPPARPLSELVSEALDAYGTTGGRAALRRVAEHVRTVGGLAVADGTITRVYRAEIARRKRARTDEALRRKAEQMSPTHRRARLRSLERSISGDLALAADLRARPYTLEYDQETDTYRPGGPRSPRTPSALESRAWVWAHQYAIIARVHEARQEITQAAEEAALLAEAGAVIEQLLQAGKLGGSRPRASFDRPKEPATLPLGSSSDATGLVNRLRALKQQPKIAICAD